MFGGELTAQSTRHWDDGSVFIEFNEPLAYLGDGFKKVKPHVKVVFTKVG